MEILDVFLIIGDVTLIIVYCLYILILRRSLIKNGQKINNFMKATLICLGISIVLWEFVYMRLIIQGTIIYDELTNLISGFLS